MKEIKLTQDKVALVDDEDFDYLNQWKWCAHFNQFLFYAERRVGKKILKMHRVIIGVTDPDIKIDHKDGDGLNNQRGNLRKATDAQNLCNKIKKLNTTSKYKGVHLEKFTGRWRAEVQYLGKKIRIGRFDDEVDAALAYNEAAKVIQGEFARLNAIEQAV